MVAEAYRRANGGVIGDSRTGLLASQSPGPGGANHVDAPAVIGCGGRAADSAGEEAYPNCDKRGFGAASAVADQQADQWPNGCIQTVEG